MVDDVRRVVVLARMAAGGVLGVAIAGELPESESVRARGDEERFGHGISGRCELALLHYRQLLGVPGFELRLQGTTLYNSIYRADDELLVNGHLWGVTAYGAPVWHLREGQDGPMSRAYRESFDAVWERSTPVA